MTRELSAGLNYFNNFFGFWEKSYFVHLISHHSVHRSRFYIAVFMTYYRKKLLPISFNKFNIVWKMIGMELSAWRCHYIFKKRLVVIDETIPLVVFVINSAIYSLFS